MAATVSPSPIGESEFEVLPSVSYSLAAVVRQRQRRGLAQEYALVHERPPRGWWLPGGGVEHHETPLDAAVRETVEEAGSPWLLKLLPHSRPDGGGVGLDPKPLPYMTHLISLEQSPGRIRFIFRGEWADDCNDNCDEEANETKGRKSILKAPPGDEESIESKWITWDEVRDLAGEDEHVLDKLERLVFSDVGGGEAQGADDRVQSALVQSMNDRWLRGHEPVTFFGMLEYGSRENGSIPGLPVHRMNLAGGKGERGGDKEVIGAFFGRMSKSEENGIGLTCHGRASLLTHFRCRLIVYDKGRHKIAAEAGGSNMFPSSMVKNQNIKTLRQLVDDMIENFTASAAGDGDGAHEVFQTGLLRVEHTIHKNGREATLTVFPILCFSSAEVEIITSDETIIWVGRDELSNDLERSLARAACDRIGKHICSLGILRDREGPTDYSWESQFTRLLIQ